MRSTRTAKGGRIDRSKPLTFRFNGKKYFGFAGDTLASALLANDVAVIGRSFKYHRPRGVIAAGADEPNAIFQIGKGTSALPNMRGTQVELYDGMIVRSTRGWPGVKFDISAINSLFGRLFSAGFYYKTFMRPKRLWGFFEYLIRHSAGFGVVPKGSDPDQYAHRNIHCDVLVVGSGPAGLSAALAAAESGARVIIVDEQSEFGGSLLSSNQTIDNLAAEQWVQSVVRKLHSIPNVTCLARSTAFGYYDENFVAVLERCTDHLGERTNGEVRERMWRIRAREVVLAQGAFERPLVFCNNDRPGIMLSSAVMTYVNRYAVLPGNRAVVFTNNDSAYESALAYLSAGGQVAAIVDSRASGGGELASLAAGAGIPIMNGHIVTDVGGTSRVRKVHIARWDGDIGKCAVNTISIDCDLLMMSGGFSPAVHLHSQAGGKNIWDDNRSCFVPGETLQNNQSVGAGNGCWTLRECLDSGSAAGIEAATRCGYSPATKAACSVKTIEILPLQPLWRVPAAKLPDRCAKQFIDYQNDTSVSDIRLAVREGYRNVEHVKRYTALGFGTDQGKLGNINGMAVLAETLGVAVADVGTTTFRPAYTPVTFGAGAGSEIGELYDPVRKTAIHDWHAKYGAPMEVVGQWWRPWYFPKNGEDIHASVARECLAARNSLAIMDASTLGKIDVQGSDSVTFLERIYTHNVGKMKPGRCAYGIMLGEDGMVMDDGVMARLGDQHFYLTTTTGGAAGVMTWLERWLQTEWPELDVRLTSMTDHWSTIAVVGPNSRKLLQKVGCNISLEKEDFSFMDVRSAKLAGVGVQLFRVSFSGELAFEINIRSNDALGMWQLLMNAGEEFDITPYGTETLHVLRAEKGFVIVGQDTDGSVTPVDLNMNWLLSKDKDYLGKRSLQRADCLRTDRKQFVGLQPVDIVALVPEGTQLVNDASAAIPVPICGHITSSYNSAVLGHPVALGVVQRGHSRTGEIVTAAQSDGTNVEMKIVSPVFYDPKSERQRV